MKPIYLIHFSAGSVFSCLFMRLNRFWPVNVSRFSPRYD